MGKRSIQEVANGSSAEELMTQHIEKRICTAVRMADGTVLNVCEPQRESLESARTFCIRCRACTRLTKLAHTHVIAMKTYSCFTCRDHPT